MPNLKTILRSVTAPIAANRPFCFFMYVLCMVSAICTVNYKWKQHLYDYAWLETWLWVYLFALVLTILPLKVRRLVRPVFYLVAYVTAIADVYCFVKFEAAINPSILMLMGETNTREAGEFLSQYITTDILSSNVGWVLLVLLVHILWTLLRSIKRPRVIDRALTNICSAIDAIRHYLAIPVVAFTVACLYFCFPNIKSMHKLMTQDTIGQVEHCLTMKDRPNQYSSLYRVTFSVYANSLAARQIDVLRQVAESVQVDSCDYRSPDIVFIIGEAYARNHSQLYGYHLPTAPRQVAMQQEGALIPFSDVISPWNLTSFVFKLIMSTYAIGDEGDWCDYPLFCEIFRKAGYHVTFLTNEFLPQAKQQVFDFSGGFFLNDPDLSAHQFDSRNDHLNRFDAGLLNDYRRLQQERSDAGDTLQQGRLTIFHLIGQHQDYRQRYPVSRRHFTTDDYADRTDLKPKWKRNLCDYDNATLYNDSIVHAITQMFADREAIVIYMPDHGEEVHSREVPHFFGRMHSTTIVKRLARDEFQIPFWVWTSSLYRQRHPDVWQNVRSAADKAMMTDAVPHMLLSLAGIHCQYYRPDLDILSPLYNARRPRIIKRQVDYDQVMKGE